MKRPVAYLALFILLAPASVPAAEADISAEQSALLYDLLSPYSDESKAPANIDPEIFARSIAALKAERLIGSDRPHYQKKNILEDYGKALFLGRRSKEFADEIGKIHDLVATGDKTQLEQAISNLWIKAGRKKPDEKALAPVLRSLYGERDAEPLETVNHVYNKPGHRIEITHARAGGRMQASIVALDDKGEDIARTVITGTIETRPNERGDKLESRIKPEAICTHTPETDKETFKSLKGKWISNSVAAWSISGNADRLILDDESTFPLRYEGTYRLGRISAKHDITDFRALNNTLPPSVRVQLINRGHTFRLYLESCNSDAYELRGTWSSQHVTYDGIESHRKKGT